MVKFIAELVGKPYQQNCYEGHAFDCYSLIHYIYKQHGIILPKRITRHAIRNLQEQMQNDITNKLWREVPFRSKKYLDVLLFATTRRLYTHVGMIVDSKFFIHAVENETVMLGHLKSSPFMAKLHKVYRWHTL